jgi:DNA repair exonuclease SbcCD ATPase subunit
MGKVEMLKSSALKSSRSLEERISELRELQEGSLAHMAAQIEPLAQAMAKLTDEYREASVEMRQQSQQQAREWTQLMDGELARQKTAMARIEALAEELSQATEAAKTATASAKRTSAQARALMQADRLRTALVAIGSGVVCGIVIFLALWIWLRG